VSMCVVKDVNIACIFSHSLMLAAASVRAALHKNDDMKCCR